MSLQYVSRIMAQSGARAVQGARDHAARSIKDTASSTTASTRVRRLSSALEASGNAGGARNAGEDKRKRAEEALRTVIFLSCWGPN